jgi:excisionase family DNA binding protein
MIIATDQENPMDRQRDPRESDFNYRVLSVQETADHLRISRAFVYKLLKSGSLKSKKLGSRTIITGAAIEALLSGTPGRS